MVKYRNGDTGKITIETITFRSVVYVYGMAMIDKQLVEVKWNQYEIW